MIIIIIATIVVVAIVIYYSVSQAGKEKRDQSNTPSSPTGLSDKK